MLRDDLTADAALARAIASEAGALLLGLRDGRPDSGARGDAAANALILDRLRTARPEDYVLSEEAADDRRRCTQRRVWIVDPLDGTREFGEGRDDWAVHVGLAIDGVPAVGAVALPALGELYDSATVAREPVRPGDRRLRIVVSRTRAPAIAERLAAVLDADVVPLGSAGVKAMAVVAGRADLYVHAGGQHEWDNCAPVAVALAAGLVATRLHGTPIVYNCADTLVPDLLIAPPDLAHRIAAVVSADNLG